MAALKKILHNVGLLLLGLFIALLLVEVLLRVTSTVKLEEEHLNNDDYLLYKIKPNLDTIIYTPEYIPFDFKTVSLGFDGIGFRDDGINGNPYAVAVGDSFTFGLGVNSSDSWVELLEKKMNKDVVNMGVWGYGTIAEERTLEKYGMKLKPKLVIVGFAVNDFSDSYTFDTNLAGKKQLKDSLKDNIAIFRFLWETFGELKHDSEIIRYSDDNLSFVFWPQPAVDDINPNYEKVKLGEDLSKESFLRINKMAKENNATLVIVLLPAKEQVYWHIVKNYVSNPEQYTYDYPIDAMNSFCAESNLNCLDLRQAFNERALKGEKLFFYIDSHYEENGNKLVADEVHKYLVSNRLIN